MAEVGSMFLAAAPTGVTQAAAIVIQLALSAFGAAGMVKGEIEALKHGSPWLTTTWTAHGKRADRGGEPELLRMLVAVAVAALAYLGAKGDYWNRPTWWRTGVVLGAEGCRILVRGETARNRVETQVAGAIGQRAALSIVRNYFDAVHRYYAKLRVKERVPVPEPPEVDVGYDHLVKLEREEGLDHSLPEDADRKYTVRELLEGVRDDGARRRRRRAERSGDIVLDDLAEGSAGPRPTRPVGSPYRGKIDVGILTIREDENAAVLRRCDKVATEERRRRYRIRSLTLPGGGAYTLAVLRCLEQGNTDAQAAATALLDDLAPRFVLVVGIAAGVPSYEFSLGDVVVSSRIADFSVEAVIRDKGSEHALGGGPLHPDAAKFAADIGAMIADGELDGWNSPNAIMQGRPPVDLADDRFYGDDDWKKSARKKVSRHFADKAPRPPLAIIGAIASSDRLIQHRP